MERNERDLGGLALRLGRGGTVRPAVVAGADLRGHEFPAVPLDYRHQSLHREFRHVLGMPIACPGEGGGACRDAEMIRKAFRHRTATEAIETRHGNADALIEMNPSRAGARKPIR
ncbi:hypothetical protein AB0K52_08805 [Glycomyces sp. NPDC049804]|uniref:hypothetical protein n=1 Tax=Glycomyces sp. NPDC049804 TaxID=3154363 RepID=UPI003441A799